MAFSIWLFRAIFLEQKHCSEKISKYRYLFRWIDLIIPIQTHTDTSVCTCIAQVVRYCIPAVFPYVSSDGRVPMSWQLFQGCHVAGFPKFIYFFIKVLQVNCTLNRNYTFFARIFWKIILELNGNHDQKEGDDFQRFNFQSGELNLSFSGRARKKKKEQP